MLMQFQMRRAPFRDFGGVYITKYILKVKFWPKTQLVVYFQVDLITNVGEDKYIKKSNLGFDNSFEFFVYKVD